MNVVSSIIVLFGALISLLAGVGLVRLDTSYGRLHAAGKASPVGFLVIAIGVAIELGGAAALHLSVAAAGLVVTLPLGVHLLFRAAHRADRGEALLVDELRIASAAELAESVGSANVVEFDGDQAPADSQSVTRLDGDS